VLREDDPDWGRAVADDLTMIDHGQTCMYMCCVGGADLEMLVGVQLEETKDGGPNANRFNRHEPFIHSFSQSVIQSFTDGRVAPLRSSESVVLEWHEPP
jgi:hypothetical protein